MTKIQTRKRTRGMSYRVELMKNGKRISRSFNKKSDAEKFVAHATLDDDVIHNLVDTTLSTLSLKQAIQEYLNQLSGRDHSVPSRLLFWQKVLGNLCIGKVTKQKVKLGLKLLDERGLAPATLNRYMGNDAVDLDPMEMIQTEDIMNTIQLLLSLSPNAYLREVVLECRQNL